MQFERRTEASALARLLRPDSEEAVERPPSKGGDRLKGAGARQGAFVFADSPQGGKGQEPQDES